MQTLTPQEYVEAYFGEGYIETDVRGGDWQPSANRKARALNAALENIKFETELYWKKSVFFWAFIALAFIGLFTTGVYMRGNAAFYQFVVCCIGAVISFAWVAITQGSKYNQQKWCRLVHTLEDDTIGPLFKTQTMVLRTDEKMNRLYHPSNGVVTDPSSDKYELRPFCVSKINDYLSFYMAWTWVFLAVRYFAKTAPDFVSFFLPTFADPAMEQTFVSFSFFVFSAYFLVLMFFRCRTNPNEMNCSVESYFQVSKQSVNNP